MLNRRHELDPIMQSDLTLSDLPNGDHSIVFELVDDAHASLNPAVTE